MSRIAVIALGGNALLRSNQSGSISEQEKNTYETCKIVANLIPQYDSLVLTHGNGPQVGNILLRNEAGYSVYKIQKMPLDICVADSQGGIGYLTERQMRNVLRERNCDKEVVTIVTQVLVDRNDPAFQNPTKPVGAFYLKEEADLLSKANRWVFKEDSRKRGWRRVVASPKPIDIFNKNIIRKLSLDGTIVIASGGGGIPVIMDEEGNLHGVDAVIDKDLAGALLAGLLGAQDFIIFTDISKVAINFRKPNEKFLDTISVAEAEYYLAQGEFEAGSMGPKIQAAITFCKNGGSRTIITDASGLQGSTQGTIITN